MVLGVVAVAKSRIESVGEIEARIRQTLEDIDAKRLIAAPVYGLGLPGSDLASDKLRSMCTATRAI